MKHHIQRQEVLIDIGPRSDAFRIQHAAAQYARNTLLPALDEIFNELSTEDVVIHIGRISIDLGFLDEASLQAGILTSAMYQRIKEELLRVILGENLENRVTRSAVRENVLTQWWYYMEHGRLPWNSDRPDEQWYARVLEMFSVDYPAISRLRRALRDKPYFRARVSAQHNAAFLQNLVTALTSVRQEELGTAVAELARTLRFIEQLAGGHLVESPAEKSQDVLPDKPQDKPSNKPLKRLATRQMIRRWSQRLAVFLALPESQRREFIWNRLLEDAATRPAEWAREAGVDILLDWIWDRPPLMRLLADAFTGTDNRFVSRFRSRYAAIQTRTGDGASHRVSQSPATGTPTDQTPEPATSKRENLTMANSPQLNLPRQPTPPGPTDGKELDQAIEEACRIIQFLADKYRELRGAPDQPQTPQTAAELRSLFLQWAEKMEDILAVPGYARGNYIRRWLRDVMKSRSAEWANADAISILLDRIWDSPALMSIAADALKSRANRFATQFNDRLKSLQNKDTPPAVKPAPGQPDPQHASREEDLLFHDDQVPEEGILIPHAGVILIHPFLATFFSRLGLLDGKTFKDLDARQQAICLVHYLATGEHTAPEYELILPKMLCGYALEMPLPGDIVLTDEACAEGDLLLQNVVQRWEKLRNSSVNALREGFLQRNGKLYKRNDRLSLQIEAGAIDVLLDFLPWNISLVKLPWLKDILYVEWR